MTNPAKKKAPPKREPAKNKKVRKESVKKKPADNQQELIRIWDEDICE